MEQFRRFRHRPLSSGVIRPSVPASSSILRKRSRSRIPLSIIPRANKGPRDLASASKRDRHTFKDAFLLPSLHAIDAASSSKTMVEPGQTDIVRIRFSLPSPPRRTDERRAIGFHWYFDSPAFYSPYYYKSASVPYSFFRLRPIASFTSLELCSLARLGTTSLPYHLSCLVTHRNYFFIIMSWHNIVSSQPLFLDTISNRAHFIMHVCSRPRPRKTRLREGNFYYFNTRVESDSPVSSRKISWRISVNTG